VTGCRPANGSETVYQTVSKPFRNGSLNRSERGAPATLEEISCSILLLVALSQYECGPRLDLSSNIEDHKDIVIEDVHTSIGQGVESCVDRESTACILARDEDRAALFSVGRVSPSASEVADLLAEHRASRQHSTTARAPPTLSRRNERTDTNRLTQDAARAKGARQLWPWERRSSVGTLRPST